MDKEKQKNIFSWIALIGGILLLLYIAIGIIWKNVVVSRFYFSVLHAWLLRVIILVAIFSGIYGSLGKVNRATRMRSIIGLLVVSLLWVTVWIIFAYFAE